jgi:hypothetical protein
LSQDNNNNIKIAALEEVYKRARERINAKGGSMTTREAIHEIAKEDLDTYNRVFDEIIAEEDDEHNRYILQQWKEQLTPQQVVDQIDIVLAQFLKEKQKTDPRFYWFKQKQYPDNLQEFDELLKQLQRKGLM